MTELIPDEAIQNRMEWVSRIGSSDGTFADVSTELEAALSEEVNDSGDIELLCNHLRLSGNIPESYGHDTTEEKQYSKYTDALLSVSFKKLGLRSLVITERADHADVEAFADSYSFVADAKAFRLSRTAKNQKDFKVQQLANWKHGKPYAMVVCPIYQLPHRTSQIYLQAINRDVCIFSYSHLCVLLQAASILSPSDVEGLLHQIFQVIPTLHPSKDADNYWRSINREMLAFDKSIGQLWKAEKVAALESIQIGKKESLAHLAEERECIIRMPREEAINLLLSKMKIDSKIATINSVADNGLLGVR